MCKGSGVAERFGRVSRGPLLSIGFLLVGASLGSSGVSARVVAHPGDDDLLRLRFVFRRVKSTAFRQTILEITIADHPSRPHYHRRKPSPCPTGAAHLLFALGASNRGARPARASLRSCAQGAHARGLNPCLPEMVVPRRIRSSTIPLPFFVRLVVPIPNETKDIRPRARLCPTRDSSDTPEPSRWLPSCEQDVEHRRAREVHGHAFGDLLLGRCRLHVFQGKGSGGLAGLFGPTGDARKKAFTHNQNELQIGSHSVRRFAWTRPGGNETKNKGILTIRLKWKKTFD